MNSPLILLDKRLAANRHRQEQIRRSIENFQHELGGLEHRAAELEELTQEMAEGPGNNDSVAIGQPEGPSNGHRRRRSPTPGSASTIILDALKSTPGRKYRGKRLCDKVEEAGKNRSAGHSALHHMARRGSILRDKVGRYYVEQTQG